MLGCRTGSVGSAFAGAAPFEVEHVVDAGGKGPTVAVADVEQAALSSKRFPIISG